MLPKLKPYLSLLKKVILILELCTKASGFEIRTLSEHQNYNLENVHITTATLIKFAQKIVC